MNAQKMDKYSALIKQGFFECKLNMIPTSIKETYSDLVRKNPILLTRELLVDGRVVLGVEYNPQGDIVQAYTTDKKGQRVVIDQGLEEPTVRNTIAEQLKQMSKRKINTQETQKPSMSRSTRPAEQKRTAATRPSVATIKKNNVHSV